MTDKKPKITGDTVCATCWIRGQGHEIGMCHCGRGDFIDKGLLDYIILISKQQGKLDLAKKINAEFDGFYVVDSLTFAQYFDTVAFKVWLKSQIKDEGEKDV